MGEPAVPERLSARSQSRGTTLTVSGKVDQSSVGGAEPQPTIEAATTAMVARIVPRGDAMGRIAGLRCVAVNGERDPHAFSSPSPATEQIPGTQADPDRIVPSADPVLGRDRPDRLLRFGVP